MNNYHYLPNGWPVFEMSGPVFGTSPPRDAAYLLYITAFFKLIIGQRQGTTKNEVYHKGLLASYTLL